MSKQFASIWGDITVGNVTPAAEPSEEEKAVAAKQAEENTAAEAAKAAGEDVEEEEEEVEETAKEKAAKEEAAEEAAAAKEEVEEIEFDEDDVNKAFTILLDEGILEEEGLDEFDATPAGLADAVGASVRNRFQNELSQIPQTVQNYYAHVIAGNDPKTFKPKEEVKWADVDDADEEIQKAGLKQMYLNQGMTLEEAEEEIQDVEAAGKLGKKGSIAIAALTKQEEKDAKTKADLDAKETAAVEKRQQSEIDGINKLIDESEEFAGFKLDDKKRKDFKQYLFKVNPRTGKTQLQDNMSSEERKLKIAFLDFIDYNKADLAKEVGDDLTKRRKKKLARFSDKKVANKNSSRSITTKTNNGKGQIKFPTMFGNQEIEVED